MKFFLSKFVDSFVFHQIHAALRVATLLETRDRVVEFSTGIPSLWPCILEGDIFRCEGEAT